MQPSNPADITGISGLMQMMKFARVRASMKMNSEALGILTLTNPLASGCPASRSKNAGSTSPLVCPLKLPKGIVNPPAIFTCRVLFDSLKTKCRTPSGPRVLVTVGVAVTVGVSEGVGVQVGVPVSVAEGVAVKVGVTVAVAVAVGVGVRVGVGVNVAVAVGVLVRVGVRVAVAVKVLLGVGVAVLVGVRLAVDDGVAVKVGVNVAVVVGVTVLVRVGELVVVGTGGAASSSLPQPLATMQTAAPQAASTTNRVRFI